MLTIFLIYYSHPYKNILANLYKLFFNNDSEKAFIIIFLCRNWNFRGGRGDSAEVKSIISESSFVIFCLL